MSKKNVLNIYIWCTLIMMSTLTLPIKIAFSSGLIIQVITLLLLFLMLLINKLKKHILFLIGGISIFFFCDSLLFQFPKETLGIYIEMIKFGFIFYWFSTEIYDVEKLFNVYYYFALLGSVVLMFSLLKNPLSISYMSVGTQLIYCIIPVVYKLYTGNKKIINILILAILIIICTVYANRMSLVSIFSIIVFSDVYFIREGSIIKRILKYLSFFTTFFLIKFSILVLVEKLMLFMQSKGYNSYSLYKLQYTFSGGEDLTKITSGRDYIYDYSLEIINQSSFFPNGIGFFKGSTGYIYPHNLFLDLGIAFGFFMIPMLAMYLIYLIQTLKMGTYRYNYIILVFLIFSFSRLMVSSMIWIDSAFWISLGFMYRARREFNYSKF